MYERYLKSLFSVQVTYVYFSRCKDIPNAFLVLIIAKLILRLMSHYL